MDFQEKREMTKHTKNEVNSNKLVDMYLNNRELFIKSYHEVIKQTRLSKSKHRIDLVDYDNNKLTEHLTRYNTLKPILRNLELMLNIETVYPVDSYIFPFDD